MKMRLDIGFIEIDDKELSKEMTKIVHRAALKLEKNIKAVIREGGIPYIPNAPATIRRKGSSHPLIDTGEMLRSVTTDLGPSSATVYVRAPYASYNEYGAPERNVPQRPFVMPAINRTIKEMRDEGVDLSFTPARGD